MDDTGFDPFDVGVLADSLRRQPVGSACGAELAVDELAPALAAADRARGAHIRDSMPERLAALGDAPTLEKVVELNRAAHH